MFEEIFPSISVFHIYNIMILFIISLFPYFTWRNFNMNYFHTTVTFINWLDCENTFILSTVYKHTWLLFFIFAFNSWISVQLFGHVHQDKLIFHKVADIIGKAISDLEDTTNIYICPSISPVYGNNPAYRLYTLHKDNKDLLDYTQYFMDLVLSNCKDILFLLFKILTSGITVKIWVGCLPLLTRLSVQMKVLTTV